MLRLDFNAIPIFCLHRALRKIHTWKLFAYRIFAHGKIKSGRKSLVKKKKNTGPKKRERVPFWQEKKKILRESDWQWLSSTLASKFRTKKSPSKQNLPHIMLKTRFPFLSACLATKTWTIASNVILKAVGRFVVLLLSTFSGFSIFAAGFSFAFGNFAHYCVVLLNALLNDRD